MALSNKQVINVLDSAWYEECHIKGSVNAPYNQLAEYVQQFPKDTELVVYCAHYDCPLSRKAWHLLDTLGYTNIYAYEGGIVEWHQKGYPVEGPCKGDFFKEQHARPEKQEDPSVKEITAQQLKAKLYSCC